jgi:RHS repeat-associated protein
LVNRYQYNGKEFETDLGLMWNDYGARWYDPQRSVWGQIDPLAEKYYGWSGYNYVAGNPIRLIDPDGKKIVNPYEDFKQYDGLEQQLKSKIDNAASKQERQDARKELRNNRNNISGFNNYQTVQNLLSDFKKANETEYNRIDNLQLNDAKIDVIVSLSDGYNDNKQEGDTRFSYTKDYTERVNAQTKDKYLVPTKITNDNINITLYSQGRKLNTLANEFGDAIFGVENPAEVYRDLKLPYYQQSTSQFSFDYEDYITKGGKKPNPQDY